VPTLTSVSRQSIFAGDPPFFFGQSLDTTRKDEEHWTRFWDDRGLRKGNAVYACQGTLEDDDAFIKRVIERIDQPRCRLAGVVVGTIDQMLDGIVNPFFFDVATHMGKLIKLQGQANRSQIKRRMSGTRGDRSTLERSAKIRYRKVMAAYRAASTKPK
jgi:hypothetical protein